MASKGKIKSKKTSKGDTIAQIAEILALMEETHKTKDWIFQQIKAKKLMKIPVKQTMNSFQVLTACPADFIDHLLHLIKGRDIDDLADISSLTKTYHWFFCDIVAGSNPNLVTKEQVRKIIVLNELISRTETFKDRNPNGTVVLPTGDGMAIGFDDSPEKPLRLTLQLHRALSKYNETKRGKDKVLIRVGIDTGPVYIVKDVLGNDNVWGPGIIMTRRVMDLAGDMNIFASSRIAEDIKNLSPEYKEIIHQIGDYSIKHGEQLILYNIYGEGFGNKLARRKSKIFKEKQSDEDLLGVVSFEFRTIDIGLDIMDPKTMLAHHTWVWDILNISKENKDQIFYYLDGDSPKDFADMNVKVTDPDGNELDILSLSVNKPLHKEFNVRLKKPIPPRRGIKGLKLEYDWEEPERTFFYKLATDCKRFTYRFTIPRKTEIKNRALKIDPEMGYKWNISPAPTLRYKGDKTEINWEGKNLKAHEAYRFDW